MSDRIGYMQLGTMSEEEYQRLYDKVKDLDGMTPEQRAEKKRIQNLGFKRQEDLKLLVMGLNVEPETDKITFQRFVTIDGVRVNIS